MQPFFLYGSPAVLPLLGAMGPLQFEVLQYRLRDEYKAESHLEMKPWTLSRWVDSPLDDEELTRHLPLGANLAKDDRGRRAVLFTSEWSRQYLEDRNPSLRLLESPDGHLFADPVPVPG